MELLQNLNLTEKSSTSGSSKVEKAKRSESAPSVGASNPVSRTLHFPLLSFSERKKGPDEGKPIKPSSTENDSPEDDHQYMRACIMVRNDNHMLSEWVAYHYTVLPLRHLIVACDENAIDDPHDVLRPWKDLGLQYQVWKVENYTQNMKYKSNNSLFRFRQRQPTFMAKCLKYFHEENNRGWVAMVDTDEYIKLNPLDDELVKQVHDPKNMGGIKLLDSKMLNYVKRFLTPNETVLDRIGMRMRLRQKLGYDNSSSQSSTSSIVAPTVLEVLEEYSSQHGTIPCHTFSRIRYGAVTDNYTALSEELCRPMLRPNVLAGMNATKLATIRYMHHAAPQHWTHNEWTKVLLDMRRIPATSLEHVANPHQPLLSECQGAFFPDLISFIHANHYLHDWSLFGERKGDTRQRKVSDWHEMAHLRDGVRCDQMHGWLNEFVARVGLDKAKQLLAPMLES